jgi:serine/threonine protein kinase
MPLQPGDKLGHYEVLSLLGQGGMGEVYRAHHPRTGRDVAVKVLAERFNEGFDREVRAVPVIRQTSRTSFTVYVSTEKPSEQT